VPTFTPPLRREIVVLKGSLRYSYNVSSTVWRDANGVWRSQETPNEADLEAAQILLTRNGGPVVVSQAIADALTVAGIGTIT
jgi:hypothetical protein